MKTINTFIITLMLLSSLAFAQSKQVSQQTPQTLTAATRVEKGGRI